MIQFHIINNNTEYTRNHDDSSATRRTWFGLGPHILSLLCSRGIQGVSECWIVKWNTWPVSHRCDAPFIRGGECRGGTLGLDHGLCSILINNHIMYIFIGSNAMCPFRLKKSLMLLLSYDLDPGS